MFDIRLVLLEFSVTFDQLFSVMLDNEIVVVHHDCQRLPDDERKPNQKVSESRTPLVLHLNGHVHQWNLEMNVKNPSI